jgi:hypothetical protein
VAKGASCDALFTLGPQPMAISPSALAIPRIGAGLDVASMTARWGLEAPSEGLLDPSMLGGKASKRCSASDNEHYGNSGLHWFSIRSAFLGV